MQYLKSFKFWFLSIIAIYTLFGFILIPWYITNKLPTLLHENIGINLQINKASFNPYSFELSLKELELQDLSKKPALKIEKIYLNYSLLELLEKTIYIKSFEITKPKIYTTLLEDGTLNFANIMPPMKSEKEEPKAEQKESSLPKFFLQKLSIIGGSLDFKDIKKDFSLELGPYDFMAHDISTQEGSINSHSFITEIKSGGKVMWEGGLRLKPLQFYGTLQVEELQLPELYDYALPLMPTRLAHGKVSLTLPYQVDLENELNAKITGALINLKAFNLIYDNEQIIDISNIDIAGIDVSYPAQNIAIKSLHVSRPTIVAILDKNKAINFQNAFVMPQQEMQQQPISKQEETNPWSYSLKSAQIDGAKIKFFDKSLESETSFVISDTLIKTTELSSDKSLSIGYIISSIINDNATLKVDGKFAQDSLKLSSNIDLQNLHVKDFKNYIDPFVNIKIDDGQIHLDAQIKADLKETPQVNALANTTIYNFAINSLENSPLVNWKKLAIKGIDFSQEPMFLMVSSIDLEKPFIKLLIAKDGSTNFSYLTKQSSENKEPEPTKEEKKSEMKLKIGPMSIKNANADFSDLSLPFPFRTLIHDLNGGLSELDFQKSTPSTLKIDGKIDKYGYANIKGSLIPLEIKKYANIDVTFKNIDLNSLTPYSGKFVGQKIDSGKLSMDLKYAIDKASLKGSNKLNIDTLTLGEKVESPDALSLPLELAIALLKDSNNQIDIDLPVAGDMNNPDFSYGSVVWKAVGNLITGIVTAPFRFLGNLLGIDGEKLKSIDFALGSHQIINTEHEKLQNLEKILGKRPGIKLAIKGTFDEILDTKVLQNQAFKVLVEETHKAIKAKTKDEKADTYAMALKELYLKSNEVKKYEELQKTFMDAKSEKLALVGFNKAIEEELTLKIEIPKEALIKLGDTRAQNVKNELVSKYKIDEKRIELLPSENSPAARDEWIEVKLDIKS